LEYHLERPDPAIIIVSVLIQTFAIALVKAPLVGLSKHRAIALSVSIAVTIAAVVAVAAVVAIIAAVTVVVTTVIPKDPAVVIAITVAGILFTLLEAFFIALIKSKSDALVAVAVTAVVTVVLVVVILAVVIAAILIIVIVVLTVTVLCAYIRA